MGRPPFMHQDTYEVFKMTLQQQIPFPKGFPSEAKSLIRHLTDHDLSKRYGNLVQKSLDVRNHRFFRLIDFAKLQAQKVVPPHIPTARPKELEGFLRERG